MQDQIDAVLDALLLGQKADLSELAVKLKNDGHSQKEVYTAYLNVFCLRIMFNGMKLVPDFVYEEYVWVLERISGFCNPDNQIWGRFMTNEELKDWQPPNY